MKTRYVARHPMTASRELGSEMIVISGGDSRLFTLNEVGATIWKTADGASTIDDIARAIAREYDVRPEAARDDAEAFVNALVDEGILVASDEPAPAPAEGNRG